MEDVGWSVTGPPLGLRAWDPVSPAGRQGRPVPRAWRWRRRTSAGALPSTGCGCRRATHMDVADELGTTRATVGKWRRRFLRDGCVGLLDEPRPGAPRTIEDEDVERVVVKTLESLPRDATHWSTRSMAKECGLSAATVSRIWRAFCMKPHRYETFQAVARPAVHREGARYRRPVPASTGAGGGVVRGREVSDSSPGPHATGATDASWATVAPFSLITSAGGDVLGMSITAMAITSARSPNPVVSKSITSTSALVVPWVLSQVVDQIGSFVDRQQTVRADRTAQRASGGVVQGNPCRIQQALDVVQLPIGSRPPGRPRWWAGRRIALAFGVATPARPTRSAPPRNHRVSTGTRSPPTPPPRPHGLRVDATTSLVVVAVGVVADRLADHRAPRRNGGGFDAQGGPSVPGGFRGCWDTTLLPRSRYSAV